MTEASGLENKMAHSTATNNSIRPISGFARFGSRVKGMGPTLILLGLIIIFSLITPGFLSAANTVALLESAAIPTIIVMGLTFVIIQGSIDISVQGLVALTSILTGMLVDNTATEYDLGWWGVVLVIAVGASIGVISGLVYTILRMPSLIVTLAMWLIALGVGTLIFPSRQPRILDESVLALVLDKHFGLSFSVYIAVLLLMLAWVIERKTIFGRMGAGIGAEESVLRMMGIPVHRYKIIAFALSGLTAGIAGVISAATLGIVSMSVGEGLLFPAIAACVMGGTLLSGGKGGVLHSLIGVLIIVVLRNGLIHLGVNPRLTTVIEGSVIILSVAIATWHMIRNTRVVK